MEDTNLTKNKTIKIAYWNANGLADKKLELKEFLLRKEIDIMLIGETWLKSCHNFKIPNYCTYRNDRTEQPKGGTAILIKKCIKHYQLRSTPNPIEHTSIQLSTSNGIYKIISLYCPPRHKVTQKNLEDLLNDPVPTMALGDLNAKHISWGCNYNNKSGRALQYRSN